MQPGRAPSRDDRVLADTRGLSVFIAPFLLVAFVVRYGFPGRTQRLFAWTIHPTMTPMVLASAYLGGCYFFVRVVGAHRWTAVKFGFGRPVLHRTVLGRGGWLANRRHAAPARADEPRLGAATRTVVGLVGLAAVCTGLVMFLAPARVVPVRSCAHAGAGLTLVVPAGHSAAAESAEPVIADGTPPIRGVAAMAQASVTDRPRQTALCAGWLFDGIRPALVPDPVVMLDGSRILWVGQRVEPPEGADVVDLGTATLLPGLIDTHVHLAFDASWDPVGHLAARTDDQVRAAMREAGRAALRGGVTTVRDLGDRDYLSLELRGEPDVPTVVCAGPPITTPGGHCHFLGGTVGPGEAAIRAAVREHAERGVDVIKIMASGGTLTPGTHQESAQFTAEELRAAVEQAHELGLPITAHAHGTQAIVDAVAAGVDGMEHVSFWSSDGIDEPGEVIELIARRRIVVGATVGLRPVPGAEPPEVLRRRLPFILANTRRLHQAGAQIVAGTDAGIAPVKPPDVLRHALPQLLQVGMTPAEALRAITSVAAQVCRLGQRKGRIAAGYDADVLVVDGDPVADPEGIHRIRAVYRGGRVVPAAAAGSPPPG